MNQHIGPVPCPTCGHCPTCGRSPVNPFGVVPTTPFPWIQPSTAPFEPWNPWAGTTIDSAFGSSKHYAGAPDYRITVTS